MKTIEELPLAIKETSLGTANTASFKPYLNDEPGNQVVIIKAPNDKEKDYLFPPIILESSRDEHTGTLNVCAQVLIDETVLIEIPPKPVSFDLTRTPPEFYISIDGLRQKSKQFKLWEVKFSVPNFPEEYTTITTFLHHTDPETSRGTETTVQPM